MHLRKNDLNIPDNSLILEIGGGGNPFYRSDILVDRFLDDETGFNQRGRVPLVIDDRVIIQADGALMPFMDHQFKYVICSHVIEHVPVASINEFIKEVNRVASAGYYEAPSILHEAIRDIPEHIWYVVCKSGVIHLCKKTSVSRWQPFLDPLFYDDDFGLLRNKYPELFYTGFEWQGSVQLQIHDNLDDLISLYPPEWARKLISYNLEQIKRAKKIGKNKELLKQFIPPILLTLRQNMISSIKNRLLKPEVKHLHINWSDLVVCPICHSRLRIDLQSRKMVCEYCRKEYRIREDGIPSFI